MVGVNRTSLDVAKDVMRRVPLSRSVSPGGFFPMIRTGAGLTMWHVLVLLLLSSPVLAGTLGGEPSDFGNPGPTFTVTTAGAHTVTGSLGPTPTDGQDTFKVTIGSGQSLTSISYSGVTTNGYGQPLNFSLFGCGLSGVSNFNQSFANATGCTLEYYIGTDFQTSAGAWTVTVNTINTPNSAPTDIILSNSSVSPSAGTNAVVGTLSTSDPNGSDTHTYSLVAGTGSTNNASFNISGATLRATNTLAMAPGSYSIRVRTTDQAGAFYEEQMTIMVSIYPAVTITNPLDNLYGYITRVSIGSINNPSTYTTPDNQGGYSDYTAQSTTLVRGATNQTVSVTLGGNDVTGQTIAVFFDWNQDGDFADAGETITVLGLPGAIGSASFGPYNATFTVPAGAVLGTTRMRVVTDWSRDPLSSGNIEYGEAEDYTITMVAPNTPPTLAVNAGLTLLQTAPATPITTAILSVTDAEQAAAALTYTVGTAPTKGTLKKSIAVLGAAGTFTQADVDGGLITYTPSGTIDGMDSFSFSVSDGAGGSIGTSIFSITINAPSADLAITVTDGAATATPGTSATYTIIVSNAGPQPVTGATLSDTFPAALTGITWTANFSGGSSGATSGSGAINETINLAAGGSATYTVIGSIDPAATGTLTNMATVTPPAGTADPNPGNNSGIDTSTLAPVADLSISVTDSLTVVVAGETVTYTIVLTNLGPSDAVGAIVEDVFPDALTGLTWTGPFSGPISGTINDTINLAVGGTVTYTATGTVNPAATGTLTNTATVSLPGGTTDPNPTNNSATDTDTILSLVTLTVTVNGNGAVNSTPNEIACTPACTSTKPFGSTLTLTAVPGIDSRFSGWSDACLACGSAPDCLVTFDATKNCTATFELLPLVRIDGDQTPYYDIATALAVPQIPATIRVQATPDFVETITMTNPVAILLRGGYSDVDFTNQTSYTTISGSLKVRVGTLTVERLKIAP